MLEVTGQDETLPSQDFNRGHKSIYTVYLCDTSLQ